MANNFMSKEKMYPHVGKKYKKSRNEGFTKTEPNTTNLLSTVDLSSKIEYAVQNNLHMQRTKLKNLRFYSRQNLRNKKSRNAEIKETNTMPRPVSSTNIISTFFWP